MVQAAVLCRRPACLAQAGCQSLTQLLVVSITAQTDVWPAFFCCSGSTASAIQVVAVSFTNLYPIHVPGGPNDEQTYLCCSYSTKMLLKCIKLPVESSLCTCCSSLWAQWACSHCFLFLQAVCLGLLQTYVAAYNSFLAQACQ